MKTDDTEIQKHSVGRSKTNTVDWPAKYCLWSLVFVAL